MPETTTSITLDNILFATDFSSASTACFPYAFAIADRYHSNLYVAHVIDLEPFDLLNADVNPRMIQQARGQAFQQIDKLLQGKELQSDRFRPLIGEGAVANVLMEMIREHAIDLTVLGTHGRRALKKFLLGSIAEEVFRTAPCPVLTIGPKVGSAAGKLELHHILYLVEFAPDASAAANYAASLAEKYRAKLTVMNVRDAMAAAASQMEQPTSAAESWLDDHIPQNSDLRERVRLERGFGAAPGAILDFAKQEAVDLIVMPVQRLDPVISSHLAKPDTAYGVVSGAACPVLTISQ